MTSYVNNAVSPSALYKAEQSTMKTILIPTKRQLLDNRHELTPEKYLTNFHINGYLQNAADLLNAVNKIRGWHQNGSSLREYILKCKDDFSEIPPLMLIQFVKIPIPKTNNPYEYVIRTACTAFLRGLTWTQLKNEMKNPILDDFNSLTTQVLKLSSLIKHRPQCPKCQLHVINLIRHEKNPQSIIRCGRSTQTL